MLVSKNSFQRWRKDSTYGPGLYSNPVKPDQVHGTGAKLFQPDNRLTSASPKLFSTFLAFGFVFVLTVLGTTQAHAIAFCNTNKGAGWTLTDLNTTTALITIDASTAMSPITDVNVTTDVLHTYVGDLYATVTSPASASAVLYDQPGVPASAFGCGGDNLQLVLDDEAGTSTIENLCGAGVPTISGTYLPDTALSALDGGNGVGTWSIAVTDNATQDTGSISNICVDLSAVSIVSLTRWVSTTATCSDQLTSLSVPAGTNVYYCYTVTNSGSAGFTLATGATSESLGMDISALEGVYASGASQSTTVGPFVAGDGVLPAGTTISTAQVTASGAATGLPLTPTADISVTVSTTPVAASGNKPLYLSGTTGLSRSKPTTSSQASINGGGTQTWTLTPALQSALTFNTTAIPVILRLSESGNGSVRDFTLQLDAAGTTTGAIGTSGALSRTLTTVATEYSFSIPVTGVSSLAAGSAITLTLTNNSGNGRRVLVEDTDTVNSFSQFALDATSVINVDSVTIYDATYNGGTAIPGAPAGTTIYIRATVSDPFGDYDISSARFDIINDLGALAGSVTQATPVTELPADDPGIAIFEYAYTLPGTASGTWSANVTAFEGTEGTVSHSWSASLVVGSPSLSVLKSATTPRTDNSLVNSGENITYSLLISNSGSGYASALSINETISTLLSFCTNCQGGLAFSSADAAAAGLSLGAPSYTDRLGVAYVPALGFDANIGGVTQPLTGFMAPGASFTLIYQAQTK